MNINKLDNNVTLLDMVNTTNNVVEKSNTISGGWVISNKTIYSYPTTLQWNNTNPTIYTIDLSNYLPNDGENYEVMYYCGGKGNVVLGSDIIPDCGGWYGNVGNRICTTTVVGNGRYLTLKIYNSNATEAEFYLKAYKMVTSDVNTKVEQDLSNLTDEAKSLISDYSFPSTTTESVTLGVSGASYTAPANGWFVASGMAAATNNVNDSIGWVYMTINSKNLRTQCANKVQNGINAYLPVVKNDVVAIEYYNTTDLFLTFVYATGYEHEYVEPNE